MIRFEEKAVAIRQMLEHADVDVSEVAGEADSRAVARLDHEACGVVRIVNRAARVNGQLADGEG